MHKRQLDAKPYTNIIRKTTMRNQDIYVPPITGSRDVTDQADVIVLMCLEQLDKLEANRQYIQMYYDEVSKNRFDNEAFDSLIQFAADIIDVTDSFIDDRDMITQCTAAVLCSAAVFVDGIDELYTQLPRREQTEVDNAVSKFHMLVDEIKSFTRRVPYNRGELPTRGGRDSYGRADRDSRGGRSRGNSFDRRTNDRGGRSSYRGARDSVRGGGRRGIERQPPKEFEDRTLGGGSLLEKFNKTNPRASTPVPEPTRNTAQTRQSRFNELEVTRRPRTGAERKSEPMYRTPPPEEITPKDGEKVYIDEKGNKFLITPATEQNAQDRKNPFQGIPVCRPGVKAFFQLNNNGDIVGIVTMPIPEEEILDKSKHDATRFFSNWGNKQKEVDHLATQKALGDLQTKKHLEQLEKQFDELYKSDDDGVIKIMPEIDTAALYVVKDFTTYEAHQDFVETGKQLALNSISNETTRNYVQNKIDDLPINYNAVKFNPITLKGEAAQKSLELRNLRSFTSIRDKMFELEELLPSSTLYVMDSIATEWVNEQLRIRFNGVMFIDSFMSDIEDLIGALAEEGITVEFTNLAPMLVGTVLYPHDNTSADICRLTGLELNGELRVKFAKATNVTIIQIDSDELALFMEGNKGIVNSTTWATMTMALDVVDVLSKPFTANNILVTRDNRMVNVTKSANKGDYILSK